MGVRLPAGELIMERFGMDDVAGVVIGSICTVGTLHSDGCQQGPQFCGDDDDDVRRQAERWFIAAGGKAIWPAGLELRLR